VCHVKKLLIVQLVALGTSRYQVGAFQTWILFFGLFDTWERVCIDGDFGATAGGFVGVRLFGLVVATACSFTKYLQDFIFTVYLNTQLSKMRHFTTANSASD
jgi:hypothetical protein